MNVLHLITPSRVSGAERIAVELGLGLLRRGHEVVFGCKPGSPFVEFAQRCGLECLVVNMGGKINPWAVPGIVSVLRERRIDLINTHLSTAGWWGTWAGKLTRTPTVAHVQALNNAFCFQFADRLIACSRAVKEHLIRQGISDDKVEVVYNAIDCERFERRLSVEEAKRRLSLGAGDLVVGVIAHLSVRKGHACLLRAVAQCVSSFPTLHLLVVGEGAEEKRLRQLAASLGVLDRVHFAGYQPEVIPYLSAMDLLVLPSISVEGFGVVLAEAGAMGIPSIASDVGGMSEVVESGVTGYIVPPGDVEALVRSMRDLLGNEELRTKMGRRAKGRVEELFTSEKMVEDVERVYREIAEG